MVLSVDTSHSESFSILKVFLDRETYFCCLNIEKNISAKVVKIIIQNMRVKERVTWHPQKMFAPEDYRYRTN